MIAEPPATRKNWTYEEVAQLEDDARFEIHDGQLFEMPSPTADHQDLIGFIYRLLMAWADNNGGRAFLSPIDLYIAEREYYIPDLIFYTRQSLSSKPVRVDRKRFRVAPDLIIEIASPSTENNDRTVKVAAYAQFGVANYWIVDPESKTLEARELREGAYFIAAALGQNQVFAPGAFPGFELDLGALWDFIA